MPEQAPQLSVVMPVYNERPTLEEILRRVQAVAIEKEIVIVDDGSTDGSREFLQALSVDGSGSLEGGPLRTDNLRILYQDCNRGKGAAVRRGFEVARGRIVLIQDADLELDPADYPALIAPIEDGRADVVFGSRYMAGNRGVFLLNYVGVKATTLLANLVTGMRLTDVWTGYKVFRAEILQHLGLREDRFAFEPEVVVKVARGRWRVCEVPVRYDGRTYKSGKKIKKMDGIKGMWAVLKYRFSGS